MTASGDRAVLGRTNNRFNHHAMAWRAKPAVASRAIRYRVHRMTLVHHHIDSGIAEIVLNDADRRNAMGLAMFDALDETIEATRSRDDVHVVLIRGEGRAFCAGFDLGAAVDDDELMGTFIERLSATCRAVRRLPQVVVGAVHGAAIAGGCALVSALDIVFVESQTKLGYPVHRLGVSPAVTIPTLRQAVGDGAARAMLMGGDLIDGEGAVALGLAYRAVEGNEQVLDAAREFARGLTTKGTHALRITKQWMNELDGSLDNAAFDAAAAGSVGVTTTDESRRLLRSFWEQRTSQRR